MTAETATLLGLVWVHTEHTNKYLLGAAVFLAFAVFLTYVSVRYWRGSLLIPKLPPTGSTVQMRIRAAQWRILGEVLEGLRLGQRRLQLVRHASRDLDDGSDGVARISRRERTDQRAGRCGGVGHHHAVAGDHDAAALIEGHAQGAAGGG